MNSNSNMIGQHNHPIMANSAPNNAGGHLVKGSANDLLREMFSKETWFDDKLIPIAKRELAEAYELTDDQLDVLAHDLLKSQHEHFHQHQLQQQQNLAAVAGQQMRMSGSNANMQHMAPGAHNHNHNLTQMGQPPQMGPMGGKGLPGAGRQSLRHNHMMGAPPGGMGVQNQQAYKNADVANLNEAGFIRTY